MPIHETREDDKNARDHSERNVTLIASSLNEFSQVLPVVRNSKGVIYGGNATRRAALTLGWTHIAAAWPGTDDPVRLRALALSLNRTSELAFWNESSLAEALKDLRHEGMDLTKIGWLDSEFAQVCARAGGTGADPTQTWQGMPEFAQESQDAVHHIIVNFASMDDVPKFAALLGQKITDQTRSLWFPEAERGVFADKRYASRT